MNNYIYMAFDRQLKGEISPLIRALSAAIFNALPLKDHNDWDLNREIQWIINDERII